MNEDLKEKWVAALRGDDYEQCQYKLRDDKNRYCCLGVLLDVHDHEFVQQMGDVDSSEDGYRKLRDEIGLSQEQLWEFYELNDTKQLPFKAIADYVEENIHV
jgi:hypothetical protein